MKKPSAPETVVIRHLPLNLAEFPVLVDRYDLPRPNLLSPLPDLVAGDRVGSPRSVEEITQQLEGATDEAVRWALTPLAQPDRVLDARMGLFNSAPSLSRLYSSRKADNFFVALRPNMEFDRELVFPFTAEDLEVWLRLQLQFAPSLTLPEPQAELSGEELSFLLALADAYKTSFLRSCDERQAEPRPVRVGVEDIVDAYNASQEARDRRWILTAVDELFGLMIHSGGRSQVRLPAVTRELAEREIERNAELERLVPANGQFELGVGLTQFAGDLFTWVSLVCLHDLQIVGGAHPEPEGWEELLLFITTGSTVWVLASEGLTDSGSDLSSVRFGLRSYYVPDALEVAREFLRPLPDVTIPEEFYAPVAPAQLGPSQLRGRCDRSECGAVIPAGKAFCTTCGACANCGSLGQAGKKYCTGCGADLRRSESTRRG